MMYGASGFFAPALIEVLAQGRALCERVGDDVGLFQVLEHLAFS
jgi:hypothetical protein